MNNNEQNGRSTESHTTDQEAPSQLERDDQELPSQPERENLAWEHFCRTGTIIPGYAHVVARRLKERRESDSQ